MRDLFQGKIQGKIQTIKQADDGARLDYFNAHNTTCLTLGPAQGAEHKCLPEQVTRDSHSPPRRAQALRPDPPADFGTGRFKTQMIGPRTGLNLSGHETLPSAEEQPRQPWLGAPRAETAAAWVAESSAKQIVGSNSNWLRVGPATPVYSRNGGEPHL